MGQTPTVCICRRWKTPTCNGGKPLQVLAHWSSHEASCFASSAVSIGPAETVVVLPGHMICAFCPPGYSHSKPRFFCTRSCSLHFCPRKVEALTAPVMHVPLSRFLRSCCLPRLLCRRQLESCVGWGVLVSLALYFEKNIGTQKKKNAPLCSICLSKSRTFFFRQ